MITKTRPLTAEEAERYWEWLGGISSKYNAIIVPGVEPVTVDDSAEAEENNQEHAQ